MSRYSGVLSMTVGVNDHSLHSSIQVHTGICLCHDSDYEKTIPLKHADIIEFLYDIHPENLEGHQTLVTMI